MKVLSIRFRTVERLDNYIKQSIINHDEDVFVQIILPSNKEKFFKEINKKLQQYFIKENIYAIKSDFTFFHSQVIDDVVINFFLVQKDSAKLKYYQNLYDLKDLSSNKFYILYAIDIDKNSFIKNAEDFCIVGTFFNKYIFYHDKKYETGMLLFEIEKYFNIDIKVVDGIDHIGRELTVTKVDQNGAISFIENLSPKQIYKHYLTNELANDLKKASFTFPLLKKIDEYYKSSLILDEKDSSIMLEYKVKENDIVKLGFANSSNFYNSYKKVIKEFDNKNSDSFLLISSYAKESFFKENGFEYENAIGWFSYSEVVINKRLYDLSHSVIMINISYKDIDILKNKRFVSLKIASDTFLQLDALSNIARVSSDELERLNKKLENRVKVEVEKNLKKDSILIHRSRLAQMGEMLSLIAHQWKQPLSAISATSSGLHIKIELDMYDKEFFLKSLTKIEEFVNHLSTTIDDFSNFFKPSKIKKEFYIYQAIQKALSIATYSLSKKSIDLELDIDRRLKITTYQNELVQVLLNIIKNAENILIKRDVKNPKIKIKAYKRDKKKIIEISDNAGGIDKQIMAKIFEPYFSTKATKDSTGLGLYMSRFIVKDSLGGELKVRNSKVGAVFSIILV